MATVLVKEIHSCEPPNMVKQEAVYPRRSIWNVLFNTGRKPTTPTIYKAKEAKWTCHCGSKWSWTTALGIDSWLRDTYNPKWVEKEV